MTKFRIFFCAIILIVSCSQKKFNKADWNSFRDGYFDKREPILEDLVTNYRLKGKSIKQLRTLLGPYDLEVREVDNKLTIQMNVVTDFGWDIDPVYTKDLYLYLNKDSVVTSFEIKEHHAQ